MTTLKSVEFVSRHEAIQREPEPNTIVISINDLTHFPAPLKQGWQAVHVVQYNTTRSPFEAGSFTRKQAKEIAAFIQQHEDTATKVLVHCFAGESRSAAVALVVDEKYSLGLDQDTCELAHALTLDFMYEALLLDEA